MLEIYIYLILSYVTKLNALCCARKATIVMIIIIIIIIIINRVIRITKRNFHVGCLANSSETWLYY